MQLTVDYVSSRRGGRADATPGLGISEPASLLRRRGGQAPLYSLCWLDGAAAGEILPIVSEALHAEFTASAGRSLTSSLLRSLRTAMHTLERENASSLPRHRCTGSACAAAVKDSTLFLAAVGGAGVWLVRGRTAQAICHSEGAGGVDCGDEAEIALGSVRLDPGDAVVLASPALAALLAAGALDTALAQAADTAAVLEAFEELPARLASAPEFAAVVLGSPVEHAPLPRERRDAPPTAAPRPEPSAPGPSAPAPAPRPRAERAPVAVEEETRVTASPPVPPAVNALTRTLPTPAMKNVMQRLLLRLSVVLVLLAVFAVGLYLAEGYLSAQTRQAQAAELLAALEQKEKDALAATDPLARRSLLTDASHAADRALALGVKNDKLAEVASRIKKGLDELNGVVRLGGLQQLADFAALDKTSQPSRILAAGDDVYVLDRGLGSVWLVKMGRDLGAVGQPMPLWKRGDTVQGATLGEAVAFFWMHVAAPGIPEQLYVLESSGALVRVAQGVVGPPMRVPGAGALAKVSAAAGQAGNLYVLDAQRRVLWRYTPGSSGYEAAGQEYMNETAAPELANTVDMAMDGNFYFLMADGRVVKYAGGKSQAFPGVVPDSALRRPAGVFASPAARSVYVADTGNGRVVQFTKEGQYVRQFVAPNGALDGVRAAFVDEDRRRLYAIVGTRAYVAELPPEGKF